jgi:hypothetical protein
MKLPVRAGKLISTYEDIDIDANVKLVLLGSCETILCVLQMQKMLGRLLVRR